MLSVGWTPLTAQVRDHEQVTRARENFQFLPTPRRISAAQSHPTLEGVIHRFTLFSWQGVECDLCFFLPLPGTKGEPESRASELSSRDHSALDIESLVSTGIRFAVEEISRIWPFPCYLVDLRTRRIVTEVTTYQ